MAMFASGFANASADTDFDDDTWREFIDKDFKSRK